MNPEQSHTIMKIAAPYMRMVLGEYKDAVVDSLAKLIDDNTIILDDWKWIVSKRNHLCVTIDCKIQTLFANAIFYTDVSIVMFPEYPKIIPRVYLRSGSNYVVNLKCPYIRDHCEVKYYADKNSSWSLYKVMLKCKELFCSCCPMFISQTAKNKTQTDQNDVIKTINIEDIEIGQFIGSGAFGNVFRGKYQGTPVAIKEIKSFDSRYLKSIRREISTQYQFDNDYIIKIYGCCITEDHLYIVMELADCSLASFLRKEHKNLSDFQKGKICYDISYGLYELYSRKIIHRDIKLDNILCVGNKVKISDFGFARLVDSNCGVSYSGTASTMAPEYFKKNAMVGLKADVYSFGCIVEEIFSGIPLHSDQHFRGKGDLVRAFEERNYRPTIHDTVPPEIQEIIRLCFREQESRVTIDIVATMIYNYLNTLIKKSQASSYSCLLKNGINDP